MNNKMKGLLYLIPAVLIICLGFFTIYIRDDISIDLFALSMTICIFMVIIFTIIIIMLAIKGLDLLFGGK